MYGHRSGKHSKSEDFKETRGARLRHTTVDLSDSDHGGRSRPFLEIYGKHPNFRERDRWISAGPRIRNDRMACRLDWKVCD